MRGAILGLVVVALTACGGGGKGEKRGAQKGQVVVRTARVDMKEPRFTQAVVAVVLVVDNETSGTLKIAGADLEATFAGGGSDGRDGSGGDAVEDGPGDSAAPTVFKGSMEPRGKAAVEPGGSAEIPVEVTLIYPSEAGAFIEFTKASVQKLKITATVHTSAGDLPVDDVTDFPAPKLLQGKVSDAQMASIDEGAAGEVVLDLTLFNPNPFPVKADVWNMKITVADKELKEFDVGQGETIQANAGVQYSESFKIDKESWGPDYKQVLKRSSVSYRVVGSIKVGAVTYPSEAKGEMKFHR